MSSGWHRQGCPQFPQGFDPQHYNNQAYTGWWNGENCTVKSPLANQLQLSKYPSLNPNLAEDTTLLHFDVKENLWTTLRASKFHANRHNFALATPTLHMRLISKSFPWQIEIMTPTNITCEDVWGSLCATLQQPIIDSEWGIIIKDAKQKEAIEAAMKKRIDSESESNANKRYKVIDVDKRPKRIDYLGDMTLFKGLGKDDDFVKLRLMPHSPPCAETWVIKLDQSSLPPDNLT